MPPIIGGASSSASISTTHVLHALQDTFGHRKANNDPFGDFWGHAFDDHDPDKTYNDDEWQNNEDRTLAMEEVVFNQLQADMGKQINDKNGNPITWDSIKGLMEEWNKVREIGDLKSGKEKFDKLNAALGEFGLPKIKRLQKYVGLGCRLKYLRDALLINADGKATSDGLKDYPGAILDTKTDGASECKPLSE